MSISTLREDGLSGVTMSYEDGGKTEVWNWNGKTIRVDAGTSMEDIKTMLKEAQ